MNKFELINALQENNDLSMAQAKIIVELFFDAMADALALATACRFGVYS